jgi:predicted nucleotidyltransferase
MPFADDRLQAVRVTLEHFVASARTALGEDLVSVVLYGSAAEGALRLTSDVNLILLLRRFQPARIDVLSETLRAATASVRLDAMFLLEAEIEAAAAAFAVKFFDVQHRRRVLHGSDPFAGLSVSSTALAQRLKQVLLNLILRLRHAYATRAAREEQLPALIADAVGPLRASAATLLALQGEAVASPKGALERVVTGWGDEAYGSVLPRFSLLREGQALQPGEGRVLLLATIGILERMREDLLRLSP